MPQAACRVCDKEFNVKPSHLRMGWGKYCSTRCRSKAQLKGKYFNCLMCNLQIYRSPARINHSKSNYFFCSKSCQSSWRNLYFIEEKHPNWIGGTTIYRKILKRSGRKQICLYCKNEDSRVLVAHHLDQNRKNNKLSNLVWACLNCHHLIHNYKSSDEVIINNN